VTHPPRRPAATRLAGAIALVAVAAIVAAPARAQTPTTPPAASAAAAKGARLIDEIAAALARTVGYLEYYDQILRMEVAQGRLGAAEADARFRQRAGEIYENDFSEDELRQVMAQHRQATAAYLDRVAADLAAAQQLPAGKAEYYRSLARLRLARLREEYESLIARQLDPRPVLEAAAEIQGWARGYETLPPAEDPFAGEEARIVAVIPSPMMQAMLSADPAAVLAQPVPPGVAAPAPAGPASEAPGAEARASAAPGEDWPAPPPPAAAAAPAAPPPAPAESVAPAAAAPVTAAPPAPPPAKPPAPKPPAAAPPAAPRFAELQRIDQPEQRDPSTGRITVEAATIHVITCAPGDASRPIYIYEYAKRRAFRAIEPPRWGSPLGGRDFASFAQAVDAGCRTPAAAPAAAALGPPHDGWSINQGQILRFYGSPSPASCRADCERDAARCEAYTWVKPGAYQPGDPPVCYLMRSYVVASPHPCCITATRGPFPAR
jgi:hypothetical protein